VAAAAWAVYFDLNRRPARPCTLADVVDMLLACSVPAVQAVVRKVGRKTLRNLLGKHRRELLQPTIDLFMSASMWGEDAGLSALPLEEAIDLNNVPGLDDKIDSWLHALRQRRHNLPG
jgi:predicted nucleic acid-binding Zn ribbon protein